MACFADMLPYIRILTAIIAVAMVSAGFLGALMLFSKLTTGATR